MPVSGREISSLDFGNLIGGPLNAVVEAQGKSAIATANFIKEVGFDKDGKVKNVEFKYNRKNENGSDQEFSLTLPFLTMVPIPYISVSNAEIEFNAKITSITESSSADNFKVDASVDAGANWWFASARMTTKSSYQRTTSTSDKEERTFDMRIKVQARNVDMPAGTERVLTLLENSIQERTHKSCRPSAWWSRRSLATPSPWKRPITAPSPSVALSVLPTSLTRLSRRTRRRTSSPWTRPPAR